MHIGKTALIAGAMLAGASGVASAQTAPALVISDLHHRAAPTTNAPSLGVIPGGSTIEAGPCSRGWCAAYLGGRIGYVSEAYLDFGGPDPRVYSAPPPPPPPPPVYGPPVYGAPPPPPPPHWDWRWRW